jgi:hypothetical protein
MSEKSVPGAEGRSNMPKKREKTRRNKKIWAGVERKNAFGVTDLTPANVRKLHQEEQNIAYR